MKIEFLIENKGVVTDLIQSKLVTPNDLVLKKDLNKHLRFGTFKVDTMVFKNAKIIELRLSSKPRDRTMNTVTLSYVYHAEDSLWYPEYVSLPDTNYTSVLKLKESLEIFFLYLGYEVKKSEEVSTLWIDGEVYPITSFMDPEKRNEIKFQGKTFDMEKEMTERLNPTDELADAEWIQYRKRFSPYLFDSEVDVENIKYRVQYETTYNDTVLKFFGEESLSLKEEYRNKNCNLFDYIGITDRDFSTIKKVEE